MGKVERSPGDWLSKDNPDCFILLPEHFTRKKHHFNVGFDPEFLPYVGKIVEEIGVPSGDIDRYYIPMVSFGTADKSLFPFWIQDLSSSLFP
jgi:hypothetical protein